MIVIAIIIIITIVIIIKFKKSNYQIEDKNITFFQGELGSGKSAILVRKATNKRFSRQIYNNITIHVLRVLIWFIPVYNIIRLMQKKTKRWKLNKQCTEIYSTFPIKQKTIFDKTTYWSNVIDRSFFNWKYRIPEEKPIVVIDELEYLFPSENKKTDKLYSFGVAWLRHATDLTLYSASQNLDGVNVEFRRRINNVYNLSNCQRCIFPFGLIFSKVHVEHAIISENFQNVVMDTQKDRENNWFRFRFPKRNYSSRYGKNLYKLSDEEVAEIAHNYQKLLEKMNLKNGDKWRELEYTFKNNTKKLNI